MHSARRKAAAQSLARKQPANVGSLPRDPSAAQPAPLWWARIAADTLTFSRLVGGVAIAAWPWEPGIGSLASLLRWKIVLWSADAADGVLARRSRTPPSWIGRHDIWIDSLVTLCTGVALARMGFLPAQFVVFWPAACALFYLRRPAHTALLIFMLPLHLSLVGSAVLHRLPEVVWFAAWLAALALLARRRLKWVIALFIDGLPEGLRRWILSWLPAWIRLTPEERAAYEAFATAYAGEQAQAARDALQR